MTASESSASCRYPSSTSSARASGATFHASAPLVQAADDLLVPGDNRTEPETFNVQCEVLDQPQAVPSGWQHRPSQSLRVEPVKDAENVAALPGQDPKERPDLIVRKRFTHIFGHGQPGFLNSCGHAGSSPISGTHNQRQASGSMDASGVQQRRPLPGTRRRDDLPHPLAMDHETGLEYSPGGGGLLLCLVRCRGGASGGGASGVCGAWCWRVGVSRH